MKSKICLIKIVLLYFLSFPTLCLGDQLKTKNYVITISRNCQEGEVTCDKVTYHGVSKKSGQEITLQGSTIHSMCADGVTPCRFLGYKFKTGKITYHVFESGLLQVVKGANNVLVEEQGAWE
jgi:hypothetical protein